MSKTAFLNNTTINQQCIVRTVLLLAYKFYEEDNMFVSNGRLKNAEGRTPSIVFIMVELWQVKKDEKK